MTRRDFIGIAAVIRKIPADNTQTGERYSDFTRRNIACFMADYLATTNPRFDRARFIEAATGEDESA